MLINQESPAERVARGADWLDKVRPEWWTEIDVGKLDLRSTCHCVLGQIVGSSQGGLPGFRLVVRVTGEKWIAGHGFSFWPLLPVDQPEWSLLDELWIEQIKTRWTQ